MPKASKTFFQSKPNPFLTIANYDKYLRSRQADLADSGNEMICVFLLGTM